MWAVGAIFAELLGLGPLFAGENDIDQLSKVSRTPKRVRLGFLEIKV
jgi:hypothetical protein